MQSTEQLGFTVGVDYRRQLQLAASELMLYAFQPEEMWLTGNVCSIRSFPMPNATHSGRMPTALSAAAPL